MPGTSILMPLQKKLSTITHGQEPSKTFICAFQTRQNNQRLPSPKEEPLTGGLLLSYLLGDKPVERAEVAGRAWLEME